MRERGYRKEGEKGGRENDEREEKMEWGRGCEGERVGGGGRSSKEEAREDGMEG